MTMENIVANQGKLGKLKMVGKVRKPFRCDDCMKEFLIGSPCYDQSDYRGEGFFPEKIRICVACGENKINGGVEVKEKKSKAVKKEKAKVVEVVIDPKNGCGKDTEYQKTGSSCFWKCGEEANIIGTMKCVECGGIK